MALQLEQLKYKTEMCPVLENANVVREKMDVLKMFLNPKCFIWCQYFAWDGAPVIEKHSQITIDITECIVKPFSGSWGPLGKVMNHHCLMDKGERRFRKAVRVHGCARSVQPNSGVCQPVFLGAWDGL